MPMLPKSWRLDGRLRCATLAAVLAALCCIPAEAARPRRPDAPPPQPARLSFVAPADADLPGHAPPDTRMENDYLTAVVSPAHGGRLLSLHDKFTAQDLLAGDGFRLHFDAERADSARPVNWKLHTQAEESVSVFVGATDPDLRLRRSLEYRLLSEHASLLCLVRLENAGQIPLDADWSGQIEMAATPGSRPVVAGEGLRPASGDSWAFAGWFDDAARQGAFLLHTSGVEAERSSRQGSFALRAEPRRLLPGQRAEWVLLLVGVHGMDCPGWMSPQLAAGFRLDADALAMQAQSFEFMNWLQLVVERDGQLIFEQPWLLQPRDPLSIFFPLSHPGERLEAGVADWRRTRWITHLRVRGTPEQSLAAPPAAEEDVSEASYTAALQLLLQGAEAEGTAALSAIPRQARAFSAAAYRLALLAAAASDATHAEPLAGLALAADPEHARARPLRAWLRRALRQREAAVADLHALLAADPLSPFVASESLFWAEADSDDARRAREEWQRLTRDGTTAAWVGETYQTWGATREAEWSRRKEP